MNQPRTAHIHGISAQQQSNTEAGKEAVKLLVYRYKSRGMTTELATLLVDCGEIRLEVNARLIAAAPAMLEALKELYRLRGLNCDLQDEASLRARAAIALATEDSK